MTRSLSILCLALSALACGGSLNSGQNHLSQTLGVGSPDILGTWKPSGHFFGRTSAETNITFSNKPETYVFARRATSDQANKQIAEGIAALDGENVYVAWSSDESEFERGYDPKGFALYVFDLKSSDFEVATSNSSADGLGAASGSYENQTPLKSLADGASSTYSIAISIKDVGAVVHPLVITRSGERYSVDIQPAGRTKRHEWGTGLLVGDKFIAVLVTDEELKLSQSSRIGISAYKLSGVNDMAGKGAFLETAVGDPAQKTGREYSSKLPPQQELVAKMFVEGR